MELKCQKCESLYEYVRSGGRSKTICPACQRLTRQEEMRWKAVLALGGKCSICGYDKCFNALEFHSNKGDVHISKIYNWSWDKIATQISDCEILCANCHIEKHTKKEENKC